MKLFATEHPFVTGRDISSSAFWDASLVERDETFAWLRKNAPVSWHRPLDEGTLAPPDHGQAGLWAVTLAADIQTVSHHHEIFSSAMPGPGVGPRAPGLTVARNFLSMDPPEHTLYRNIISGAFTPKGVAQLREKIEERAAQIVDSVVGLGDIEFVSQVSSKLPMLTIADMVGVPESQVEAFTRAGNDIVTASDPGLVPEGISPVEQYMNANHVLRQIGLDLVRYRRRHPADDIATALAQAEIDDHPLSDDEVNSIMVLLSAAGNDTTRHTTSWTALNLCRNPEQKDWLREDFESRIGQAVEEFIRHASVVNMFARTATRDTELGGQQIAAGDKVAMFYCSGNRDETVFSEPHRFDLKRPRTTHVAFGGRGVHFCLGNVVAKAQLRAIFSQILSKLPDLEIIGEPVRQHSELFNAVRYLPALTH